MPRLSIDISPQEHQQLKAMAALKGQSIKDYVLNRTLAPAIHTSDMTEAEALQALRTFLEPRIEQAHQGRTVSVSASDIGQEARTRL